MSQPVQRPGDSEQLQRAHSIVGRLPLSLEQFILPVDILHDLSKGSAPPLVYAASSQFSSVGVALGFPVFRLEAPGNVLAHVRNIEFAAEANAGTLTAFHGSSIPAPATIAQRRFTDGRVLAEGVDPACVLSFGTQVAGLAGVDWRRELQADVPRTFRPNHWIVGSGRPNEFGFIEFLYDQVNTSIRCSISWDEYRVV